MNRHQCFAELCDRQGRGLQRTCKRPADVLVRGRHGENVYYCRRHAKRGTDPQWIAQPATIIVLAGRYWDADRADGGSPNGVTS